MTDIRQLLPKDVYDAAVGANSPSAANVFATIADIGGGATLAATLTAGDAMLAGQKIRTSNATSTNKFAIESIDGGAGVDVLSIYRDNGGSHDNSARIDMLSDRINIIHRGTASNLFQIDQANGFQFSSGNSKPVIIKMNSGFVMESGASLRYATFAITPLTAPQTYTFQDGTGTVAFLTDIPTVAGVYLPLAGGTMTGDIDMNGNTIQLSDESGDIQAISTNSGDIIISSDAYYLRVETDSGLYVNNGIRIDGSNTLSWAGTLPTNSSLINLQDHTNSIQWLDGANTGDISAAALTGNQTWTLPNATGVIALDGDWDSGQTYIVSNDNTLRTIDANNITGANLRDLICTLIRDLNTAGVLTV